MTTRVQIDLNSRDSRGYVRARPFAADEPVATGDVVLVVEPQDRVTARAEVIEVDHERGVVYLRVDWDSLEDTE